MIVTPLDASHKNLASVFCSGNLYLDSFIKSSEAFSQMYGKTYVMITEDGDELVGYYNIGMGYLEDTEEGIRYKIGGAVHINALALNKPYHGVVQDYTKDGKKIMLSDFLMDDCIKRIENIRQNHIGCAFVTLSSTEEGYSLYKRNGFEELEDGMHFSPQMGEEKCPHLYLALDLE